MRTLPLEPMSIGKIFDYTFKIYRDNFLKFIAIVAVVMVPVLLLQLASQALVFGPLLSSAPQESEVFYDTTDGYGAAPESDAGSAPVDLNEGSADPYDYQPVEFNSTSMVVGMIGSVVAALLTLVALHLSQGALTLNVSEYYLGRDVGIGQAYRHVLGRLGRLIGAAFLVGLVVGLGFLLFIVPGIIFGLWFALTIPVILVEDLGVTAAMSRSRQLVSGNLGRAMGVGLIIWLLSVVIQIPFNVVGQVLVSVGGLSAMDLAISGLLDMAGTVVVAPIAAAAYILFYYDLRIRKEGFDLEMLAGEVQSGGLRAEMPQAM